MASKRSALLVPLMVAYVALWTSEAAALNTTPVADEDEDDFLRLQLDEEVAGSYKCRFGELKGRFLNRSMWQLYPFDIHRCRLL